MMLSPSSQNEPFKPFFIFPNGRRSAIPDDLTATDVEFFAEIAETVTDIRLRARLADLVWLKGKPRNVKFALMAIDAYRDIPLDAETWVHDGKECWERAISLAQMIKAGAGDRLEQMETHIVASFNAATRQDGFLGLWLARLLKTNGWGRLHQTDIAQKLETLALEFDGERNVCNARKYFSASADWYRIVPDKAKAAEMTVFVAENWVKEAVARVSSDNPSHMAAASFYENAIQIYRTIPKTERTAHRVDERVAELRAHLNESGEKTLGEMTRIRTPGIDITSLVEKVRISVRGKSATEALLVFAHLCGGAAKVDELRNRTLEQMREFPIQWSVAMTVRSQDGRVIAKRPPMNFNAKPTEDNEDAIRYQMIRLYSENVGIAAHGIILPALEFLLLEHRLREADFVDIANQSPIVPKGRAGLFGKALFAGFDRDFVTALHLLLPQIEHLVRVHLKQAGAKTTNLDKDGIENENGMGTLMNLPEAEQVFGRDLAFELRALFCDAFGPNLRNELAHGLLDEKAFHSPFTIYAWWLGLHLVFNTWWNMAHKSVTEGEAGPDD
ncbi:DUF4209 domain-containing protein [Verminephrobacter eiseniae]|uniref:DUF4209 domain-containing protein n=1 Tax=Verminephrobacter eiseniae TaxID=364317 RepID=UPI0022390E2B|nr:DUF4209 domain-containing protein [Verminephrobacter eiseniae]